ncbi:MAG: hypothetical protein JWR11_4322 [Mycobacterium sp.]|jgi:hypothetical protein|nr:hypothetical protein [Mycobacterium sp.]
MSHGYRTAPNRLDAIEPATLVSAIGGTTAGVRVLALNTDAPAMRRCGAECPAEQLDSINTVREAAL